MLIEITAHALQFDFAWIIGLIMANLHYVFAFILITHFFGKEGNKMKFLGMLTLGLLGFASMNEILGLISLAGAFLMLFYITRMVLLVIIEEIPALRNKMVPILTTQMLLMVFLYNIFLV